MIPGDDILMELLSQELGPEYTVGWTEQGMMIIRDGLYAIIRLSDTELMHTYEIIEKLAKEVRHVLPG